MPKAKGFFSEVWGTEPIEPRNNKRPSVGYQRVCEPAVLWTYFAPVRSSSFVIASMIIFAPR